MMKDALRSIGYFLTWGVLYGFLLGVWSTTMILPLVGTFYGLFWGPLIGGICGLVCGVVAALTQLVTFHADIDLGAYRRRASLGFGLLITVAAPIALMLTSETVLWYSNSSYQPSGHEYLPPSLIAAAFWGPLAAAYVAHFYPLWLAHLKSGQEAETSLPPVGWQVPNAIADLIRTGTHWLTIGVGIIVGPIIHHLNYNSDSILWWRVLEGAVLGGIGSLIVMVMLAIGNGTLAIFLRQLFFSEDHVAPQTQRRIMSVVAAVFTGAVCLSPLWSYPRGLLLLLPVIALAALYMYRAYPSFDHTSDKFKRKEKNAFKEDTMPDATTSVLQLSEPTSFDEAVIVRPAPLAQTQPKD